MNQRTEETIYPAILPVPDENRQLTGKKQVAYLSRYARHALALSAQKSGRPLKQSELAKNENGVPLPVEGKYWSVTHKPEYVGGVLASTKIGIDIEKIRPCSALLFKKVASDEEWGLSDADPLDVFFRYWTSKEAVLKAVGTGLRDLPKCKISQITDDHHLIIEYRKREWFIEHFYFKGHIASIVKNTFDVSWALLASSGGCN